MIRTLNSLRFILILMIVISHSTLPISQDLINYLGEFPVAIFFVISGFVLSLSKGEKLQKEVLGNRNFFPFPYHQTLSSSYSDSRHSWEWYCCLSQCISYQSIAIRTFAVPLFIEYHQP